jgi:hypothetical protein
MLITLPLPLPSREGTRKGGHHQERDKPFMVSTGKSEERLNIFITSTSLSTDFVLRRSTILKIAKII